MRVLRVIVSSAILFVMALLCTCICTQLCSAKSQVSYKGIDVSEYQGNIDFEKVKNSGIEVVYIRAGEGNSYIDPYFKSNCTKANAAGLKVGFYYYVTATSVSEGETQAQVFYDLIKDKSMNCRPAMDFEYFGDLSNSEVNKIGLKFMKTLENLLGFKPVIYSDASNAKTRWNSSFKTYPLWIADYDVSAPYSIGDWTSYSGFQYSDSGNIDGINAKVDLDKFRSGVFIDSSKTPKDSSTKSNSVKNKATKKESKKTHTVKKGDTVWSIAKKHGVSVDSISKASKLKDPNKINIGDTLTIPKSSNKTHYKIKTGDCLSVIAYNFNVDISDLIELNNISNPHLIYAQTTILIPSYE